MNIVVDGVIFQLQAGRSAGVSRVWRHLLPELARELSGHRLFVLNREGTTIEVPGWKAIGVPTYGWGSEGMMDQDDGMLGAVCRELGADVFLSTYFTRAPGLPNLLMVYDMIPEVHGWDLKNPEWVSKRRAIANAWQLLTISHSTWRDLTRIHGVKPGRAAVTHCGVGAEFQPRPRGAVEAFRSRVELSGPYVVLVGGRGLYKNSVAAFEAVATMPKDRRPALLLVGGEPQLLDGEARFVKSVRCVQVPWLSDEDLSRAYSGAQALVYPSRYEGFGLPVLEALACGCPVIIGHNSSLPEVAGEAALYVDPDSPADLARAVESTFDADLRIALASAGVDRARGFSWRSMGREVAARILGIAIDAPGLAISPEQAPQATGEDLNTCVATADRCYAAGDLAGARTWLQRARALGASSPELLRTLGSVHFQLGEPQAALEVLRQAAEARSDDADLLVMVATAAISCGDVDAFESALGKALELVPSHRAALGLLLDLNLRGERYLDAARTCQRILSHYPADVPAKLALGKCFYRLGDPDTAKEAYREVLATDPANAIALEALGVLDAPAAPPGGTVPPTCPAPAAVPRVSAIVSTYKSQRFIRGCLEDLVRQTLFERGELEIIVVNSGSPEAESEVVREFQSRYPNIRLVETPRETVYGAWNRAIEVARGHYLTNSNTDDRHRRDALEVLAQTLDARPEVTVVYADCWITETENETFETAHAVGHYRWLEFDRVALLKQGCFLGPQPMWRKEVHAEHGVFDASMVSGGDYEFWLRIAVNRSFLHVQETLGLYLKAPTSVEHANQGRAVQEALEAQRRHGKRLLAAAGVAAGALDETGSTRSPAAPGVTAMGDLSRARELRKAGEPGRAWIAALECLAVRPFHPEAYLLLAEIASAAGDPGLARECAQRARDLAPQWRQAKKILRALPTVLKKNQRTTVTCGWPPLPESTQPPRLTVCVIAKNEQRFLPQCLRSVQGVAWQTVVLDTGSTDRTVEIARDLGAEVHTFEWCDDFSAAKNAALEHARGDWVLFLDADEELASGMGESLGRELLQRKIMAYRVPLSNLGCEEVGHTYVPRLFRNAPGVYFMGRVHEQPFTSIDVIRTEWGLEIGVGESRLLHHGYSAEVIVDRQKGERNLSLLRRAVDELPNDPNLHMNLGLELTRCGRPDEGLEHYLRSVRLLEALPPTSTVLPEFRECVLSRYAMTLLGQKEYRQVVDLLDRPSACGTVLNATVHYAAGMAAMNLQDYKVAAEQFELCLSRRKTPSFFPLLKVVTTTAPVQALGLAYAQLGRFAEAEEQFREALKDAGEDAALRYNLARVLWSQDQAVPALEALHALISLKPDNREAWLLGGQIATSKPEFLEFGQDWTGEAVKHLPADPEVQAQRAEVLMLRGELLAAAPHWRAAARRDRPERTAALILCELCLDQLGEHVLNGSGTAVNGEFLRWYQRLVQAQAMAPLHQINQRLGRLEQVLPGAARALRAAMAEAEG